MQGPFNLSWIPSSTTNSCRWFLFALVFLRVFSQYGVSFSLSLFLLSNRSLYMSVRVHVCHRLKFSFLFLDNLNKFDKRKYQPRRGWVSRFWLAAFQSDVTHRRVYETICAGDLYSASKRNSFTYIWLSCHWWETEVGRRGIYWLGDVFQFDCICIDWSSYD